MSSLKNKKYKPEFINIFKYATDNKMIIISAFRAENSFEQNMESHKRLLKETRGKGFGFIELFRKYEKADMNDGGELKEVITDYFICIPYLENRNLKIEDFYELGLSLARSFEQESFIMVIEGNATIEDVLTGEVIKLNEFSITTLNNYLSSKLSMKTQKDDNVSLEEGLNIILIGGGLTAMGMGARNNRIMGNRRWNDISLINSFVRPHRVRGNIDIKHTIAELSKQLENAEKKLNNVQKRFNVLVAEERIFNADLIGERNSLELRAVFLANKPQYCNLLEETLAALSALPVPMPEVWPESLIKERIDIGKEIDDLKERIAEFEELSHKEK